MFAGIASLVALAIRARRVLVTWHRVLLALGAHAAGRLKGIGAAAALGGPLGLIVAGSPDLAALLALVGGALPELRTLRRH